MKKLHIFTCAACNYIPKVRMLFRSLRELHPEATLHLALADALPENVDLSTEPFDEIIPVSDLSIPEWKGWSFCHSIVELSTAIKPFYLKRLLERDDCDQVLYLDPDMVVFSRLDDILETLEHANLILTPHQTDPDETLSAIVDNEICSLKHGIYNLGFIGVANTDEGRRFAAWWASRMYSFCRSEIHNGLFTDQRWIDLVPAFFDDVAVSRSPRHNVATWNLTTRELTHTANGTYLVNGEPLGFYHFTGFDSGAHRTMASKNAPGNRAVTELIEWYDRETRDLSRDPLAQIPWAFGRYSDGTQIELFHRLVYRDRPDLQRHCPDPFAAGEPNSYLRWLDTQGRREYPDLFKPETVSAAIRELTHHISHGFRGSSSEPGLRNGLGELLSAAVRNPSFGVGLTRRVLHILKHEGIKGISRRLSA